MKTRSLVVSVIVASAISALPTIARAQALDRTPVIRVASAAAGVIEGHITTDRGAPVQGAVVSVLGATTHFAVTDASGHYVVRSIPAGVYMVRALRTGYVPSTRMAVDVRSNSRSLYSVSLRTSAAEVGTAGAALPADLLLAGVGASDVPEIVAAGTDTAAQPAKLDDDDHSERAWRLRHLKRSVLKDSATSVLARTGSDFDGSPASASILGRAFETSARVASSLFQDFPFSGEVNLLTSSAFDTPMELFSGDGIPTGVAHFLLNGSAGANSEWTMHGAMTHGDVVSWFVAGSYRTRTPALHAYDLGLSYSTQRYDGGNPEALAAVGDVSRNVGTVHGYDHWTISPSLSVDYGARYARYGYLAGPGLFSPRVGVTYEAANRLRVTSLASVRMIAPGAEEFVPPIATGLWVPPERTFSPLRSSDSFVPEKALHYQFGVERDLGDAYVLALRMFRQQVDNQLVALFGVRMPDRPAADLGHYFVANGGDFGAHGWGVSLTHAVSHRVRGSIDYSLTTAAWKPDSVVRRDIERLHDLTTSLQTDIPQTSTRVVVFYRLNSGFSDTFARSGAGRRGPLQATPDGLGLAVQGSPPSKVDGRFDVQVNQSLPFLATGSAQWEVLVAVRNIFRESLAEASVYDELLVVRPPKRILGGVMVRF